MNDKESNALGSFTEAKGEAKYNLYKNAATSARGVRRIVFAILLSTVSLLAAIGSVVLIKSQHKEIKDLARLNAKLETAYIDRDRKAFELLESFFIGKGILFDQTNWLNKALTSNPYRNSTTYGKPHKFTFNNWNDMWQTDCLERSMQLGSTNTLRWITEQPDWNEDIPDELAADVYQYLNGTDQEEDSEETVIEGEWFELNEMVKVLSEKLKEERRKKRLLMADKFDAPSYIDGSRPNHEPIPLGSMSVRWMNHFMNTSEARGKTNLIKYVNEYRNTKTTPTDTPAE